MWNRSTITGSKPLARSRRPALVSATRRVPVTIVEQGRPGDREALIESIHRRSQVVEARLTLDDGVRALAVLSCDEADWLEIERGGIVFVKAA